MKNNLKIYGMFIIAIMMLISCQKNWLDAKPDRSLVVPSSIGDYQALLDNTDNVFSMQDPALGEMASDYFVVADQNWTTLTTIEKYTYIWDEDPYKGESCAEWGLVWEKIFNANVILSGIEKVTVDASNKDAWNNVKGSALFYRAMGFYGLTQVFCKPYDQKTADLDLGLPLRLSPKVTQNLARSSLKTTYSQILRDLNESIELLPDIPVYKTRPSKAAAWALLSRIYLSMEDYDNALIHSDLYLKDHHQLMNYNTLDSTAQAPIANFNAEVVFRNTLSGYTLLGYLRGYISPEAYTLYDKNDLRRSIFFRMYRSFNRFWGNYGGAQNPFFNGMATDEQFLINAEAKARLGKSVEAITVLNNLLSTRWKSNTYRPVEYTNDDALLNVIITERRKELIGRGLRWSDLRRLNRDPRFAVTLKRTLNGQVYTLPPNDPRYTFPIPPDELRLSGIEQNPR